MRNPTLALHPLVLCSALSSPPLGSTLTPLRDLLPHVPSRRLHTHPSSATHLLVGQWVGRAATRLASRLCLHHGRPPGLLPSFQRSWVQSKATQSLSLLWAAGGCSQSAPGLAVGLPAKFMPRKRKRGPVNLMGGEGPEGGPLKELRHVLGQFPGAPRE